MYVAKEVGMKRTSWPFPFTLNPCISRINLGNPFCASSNRDSSNILGRALFLPAFPPLPFGDADRGR